MSWSISRPSYSDVRRFPVQNNDGFTLVEILVAISILAIVLTSVYGIFTSVSAARERLDTDSAEYHRARVIFDRLGRELRGAYFQPGDSFLTFSGEATQGETLDLQFTTSAVSPLSRIGSGIARIHYRLIDDDEADGLVLLRSEHSAHEDVSATEEVDMMRLASGIEAMTVRFLANGGWQTKWDGESARELPELVEIGLQLKRGDAAPAQFVSAFEIPDVEVR